MEEIINEINGFDNGGNYLGMKPKDQSPVDEEHLFSKIRKFLSNSFTRIKHAFIVTTSVDNKQINYYDYDGDTDEIKKV